MLERQKRCKICQYSKQDKKLLKRIANSTYYDKTGTESLTAIHKDYKDTFSYGSLTNHAKKHQGVSQEDLNNRRLNQAVKEEENKQVRKAVKHGQVRQLIMDKGYEGIESGEIQLRAPDVLRAAEGEVDIEEKHKDRQATFMKMVWAFASEENKDAGRFDSESPGEYIDASE